MKVLFVYPVPPERYQIFRYQQGIGSISAVLRQAGHETGLLRVDRMDPEILDAALGRLQPQLVALSLTSGFMPLGAEIARWVADNRKLPVILGGIHPTVSPEESVAAEGVFAICRGEGEYPMLELCEALEKGKDPAGIANLWLNMNGSVHRNEMRPLIADLDSLPYPDRDLFDFGDIVAESGEAEFMAGRGCPHLCACCVNHVLQDLYRGKGTYVRFRSVDNLLGEIEAVTRQYPGVLHLGLHDDTFTVNRRWLREFAGKYPARFKRPFWCNATAGSIDEEIVELLKKAGCFEVRIGIESGNDRIRTDVLNKRVSREEIIRAFGLLKEAGIRRYAFNMVGLPFETVDTIRDTIRLNRIVKPDQVFCSIFYPYSGTRGRAICAENGWLTEKSVASYFENEYAVSQPSITREEVIFHHDIFRELVQWPRAEWIVKQMARIRVTRNKSLWNAWRRIRAKCGEFLDFLKRGRQPAERRP